MTKYKVGDIFINHNDGKILQVCEGKNGCTGCVYKKRLGICSYGPYQCRKQIGNYPHFKELPFLPIGTKVKVREDLKVGIEYGDFTFSPTMKQYKEVTIKSYSTAYRRYDVSENNYMYSLEMFDQVINEPKENNNMETKEIKIKVPEGYEIDEENSALDCIKFKPIKKELTYKDVAEKLFGDTYYFTAIHGEINSGGGIDSARQFDIKEDKNNAASKKQLERLLALNQLLNIAEYYNKRHLKEEEFMYCISLEGRNSEYFAQKFTRPKIERGLIPEFNREEDARAVINNPNFKEILDLVYKGDEN